MLFLVSIIFFLNDTANTEIYTYCHTLSLHDALPAVRPGREEGAATAPSVVAAAAGASPGWRRASLFVEQDDDVSAIGQTGLPCIMGTVMTGPAAGNALFFDDAATMEVELLAEGMVLTGASDDALLRGANLCLAGDRKSTRMNSSH